jgi:hypothetical protein
MANRSWVSQSRMTRRDHVQQGASPGKDRAPYAAGSEGEEVAQIGEPPAPRRAGSLVESCDKLDSQRWFPGAVQLVKASHGGGANRRSRRA